MNIRNILLDIHALEEELLDFERIYGVRSEIFYVAYARGEEPENDNWVLDFGEWFRGKSFFCGYLFTKKTFASESVYQTWLTRQAEYRNAVQQIQRQTPTLTGLIQLATA